MNKIIGAIMITSGSILFWRNIFFIVGVIASDNETTRNVLVEVLGIASGMAMIIVGVLIWLE